MAGRRIVGLMVATSLVAAGTVAVSTWMQASAAPEVVRLHLGTDAQRFSLGSSTQSLTVGKNSCAINSAEPLIDISSSGSQSAPGLANLGLGVRASPSSGNGTPCAQVDKAETLTLKPGSSLTSRLFKSLRLDLEMTGNAIVVLTVSRGTATETYRLLTGVSITAAQSAEPGYDLTAPYFVSSTPSDAVDACASPNSSGPNSAGNDNCQWTITPSFNFDTISLTTSLGTVTLEGAGDFANDQNFDSLFYLSNSAPTAVNDSVSTNENTAASFNVLSNDTDVDLDPLVIDSVTTPEHGTATTSPTGDLITYTPDSDFTGTDSFSYTASDGTSTSNPATVTVTVYPVLCSNDSVTDTDGDVSGTFERLDDTFECKRYALEANAIDGTVLFSPKGNLITVDYRGYLSFGPEPAPGAGGVLNLLLEYDPLGGFDFQPVQWCINPQFDPSGAVTSATLPGSETWCIASEATHGDINGDVVTTWQVFGHDDPRFI